ncbi:hypothetical protein GW17_00010442 [Ensete ventricosum]|nr:hypothetical protein GW17_00010442 [Ensete ventricosum]
MIRTSGWQSLEVVAVTFSHTMNHRAGRRLKSLRRPTQQKEAVTVTTESRSDKSYYICSKSELRGFDFYPRYSYQWMKLSSPTTREGEEHGNAPHGRPRSCCRETSQQHTNPFCLDEFLVYDGENFYSIPISDPSTSTTVPYHVGARSGEKSGRAFLAEEATYPDVTPDKNRDSLASSRVRCSVEAPALPTPYGPCASGRVHVVEEETARQRKNLHSLGRPSYAYKNPRLRYHQEIPEAEVSDLLQRI